MEQIKIIGGAKIGMAKATWPLATLKVTKDILQLNATLLGTYSFTSNDVISIEPYTFFLSRGIRIVHKIPRYNNKIIFFSSRSFNSLIRDIKQIGFLK